MISSTRWRATERTTSAMGSSSLRAGMTTVICGLSGRPEGSAFRGCVGTNIRSEAPTKSAIRTRLGRLSAQQGAAKLLVTLAVPDFPQRLLGCITQREAVISPHREGGDAARDGTPVCREVHQCPRATAERPWPIGILLSQTGTGLGRPRGIETDTETLGQVFCLANQPALFAVRPLE